MKCIGCGHENRAEANYCSSCGVQLAVDDQTKVHSVISTTDHEAVAALMQAANSLKAGDAMVLVIRGPNSGATYLLDQPRVNVGRSPDSSIFLDDITVSRKHCEFVKANHGYSVMDSGSMNGVYVNGELVNEKVLEPGDEVQIGVFKLVFMSS